MAKHCMTQEVPSNGVVDTWVGAHLPRRALRLPRQQPLRPRSPKRRRVDENQRHVHLGGDAALGLGVGDESAAVLERRVAARVPAAVP